MFIAQVLVMTLTGIVQLKDNRGPYETQTECRERVVEMRDAADMTLRHMGIKRIEGWCAKDDSLKA